MTYTYEYGPLPEPGQTEFGFDDVTVVTFGRAYVLSKDPRIQALFVGDLGQIAIGSDGSSTPTTGLSGATRYQMAYNLAQQGLIIDDDVDAMGADPYITMFIRQQYGYAWVPSMLQANVEGVTTGPTPPGSITVSTNIAEFPPFVPVPPVPPPSNGPLVGAFAAGRLWFATEVAIQMYNAGTLKVGGQTSQGGHTYTFQVTIALMGPQCYWKLVD